MSEINYIERAVLGENRVRAGMLSQERWYQRELHKLIDADQELQLAADREEDPVKRNQLHRQLAESKRQIDELNRRMKASSIRTKLATAAEDVTALPLDNYEERLQQTPRVTMAPAGQSSISQSDPDRPVKKLCGLAAVYDSETCIAGFFREVIRPGAFTKVLRERPDVRCLYNHSADFLLGRTRSQSLRLYDSSCGLIYWNDLLSDDPLCDSVSVRIRRKDISGSSFCFAVGPEGDYWELSSQPGELPRRIITEFCESVDVSPVAFPAYEATSVVVIEEPRADVTGDTGWSADDEEEWEACSRSFHAGQRLDAFDRKRTSTFQGPVGT